MYIGKVKRFSIFILCTLFLLRCNSSNEKNNSLDIEELRESSEEFIRVKYGLYKHQTRNAYFMGFNHIYETSEIEKRLIAELNRFSTNKIRRLSSPEKRYILVRNELGDTLKDLNEREFKYFFNYFVDDNYLFQTTDQHDFYEVYTHSIKYLPPGCYFDGSDYRIHKGSIEYYQNRGITICNDSLINQARVLFQSVPDDFEVLDIKGNDCCIVNQKIYCSGCLVEGALDEKIKAAINEKRFKKKYCYPIKNERMSK
jgi:hypothetical protein